MKYLIILVFGLSVFSTKRANAQWSYSGSNIYRSSGNVGIGYSNPLQKLHINGNLRGNRTGGAIRVQSAYGYLDIGAQNSSWLHMFTDRSKFIFNKSIYLMDGKLSAWNTQNLYLQTNGTTRMTVKKSNGYVGIGTTNPLYRLDVTGSVRISDLVLSNSGLFVEFEDNENALIHNNK